MQQGLIFVKRTAIRAVVASLLVLAGPAQAQSAEGLAWRCWYNAPEHVSCMPRSPLAKASFRHRFMHIPLHTIPFDMESVRNLAHAVACGRRPDCTIVFTREMPTGEELDGLMDPLQASAE